MRKLYFTIFIIGSIAGIGCSNDKGNIQYIPVPTATNITQACTARDANGNCLGGPATTTAAAAAAGSTTTTAAGTPTVHVATTNTTGAAAKKLANAIHTTYNVNNNGTVTANSGSGSGGSFRVSNNSVTHSGMGTESFTGNGDSNGNTVAANGADSTNGNTAAVGFNSFVPHEDINTKVDIKSAGVGEGGDSGTGGRTDSGTGAGQ